MYKFVNFVLAILVVVAFLFGVKVGKTIQKIDTPVKLEYRQKKVFVFPSLKLSRVTLSSCGFSFIIPDNFSRKVSSTSVLIQNNKDKLTIECSKPQTQKNIVVQGNKQLLQQLQAGFDPEFTYTK